MFPSTSVCFIDSSTVLTWVQTAPHSLKTFVTIRVIRIHKNHRSTEWRFVSGLNNLADPVSRGLSSSELSKCELWWKGPSLNSSACDWPERRFEAKESCSLLIKLKFDPPCYHYLFNHVATNSCIPTVALKCYFFYFYQSFLNFL